MNFDTLHVRARERGWTLSKSTEVARYGTMPICYILKDHKGLMYFRNLDEVERRLTRRQTIVSRRASSHRQAS